MLDVTMLREPFMQRALLAALLAGVACPLLGVLVVTMRLSFIGICMSHAAFAGALLGLLAGIEPLAPAFAFSLAAAFGVASGWVGLALSAVLDLPSGAVIIMVSALIFVGAVIFSPKRRHVLSAAAERL
jgi:ABC-type Mn2+/Zn2+ transport system permease subunit